MSEVKENHMIDANGKLILKPTAFSYDVGGRINAMFYDGLLTLNHCGLETFKVNDGDKVFFYPLKFNKKIYALQSDRIDRLPIRVTKTEKIGHKTTVYHWIQKYSSAVITGKRSISMKQLIAAFAPFEDFHTQPLDWTLYKAICIALYFQKGFANVATEAGFGKTSTFGMIGNLTNDSVSINPRTVAAFEFRLLCRLLNLDELTNLKPAQRDVMQDALLKTCDGTSKYQKGSRGMKEFGMTDEMDIRKLSVIITYNTTDHYTTSKQLENYFDKIFQKAVLSRFLPLKLRGNLDAKKFADTKGIKRQAEESYDYIVELLVNLKYYEENLDEEMNNYIRPDRVFDGRGRQAKTFNVILNVLDAMSATQEEFSAWENMLFERYNDYKTMIDETFNFEAKEEQ